MADYTDEQIEDFARKHGAKWNGEQWTVEDADLHPMFRAVLALAPGLSGWQEISSAPKDGTRFIGWYNERADFFHWQDFRDGGDTPIGWRDSFINVYRDGTGPTRWQPITAPGIAPHQPQPEEAIASAARVVEAWDSTVLPKANDGMMQERMEDLRAVLSVWREECEKAGAFMSAKAKGLMLTEDALQRIGGALESLAQPQPEPTSKGEDESTPGPWRVEKREREGELVMCWVAADDCNGFAYAAEILGDDEYRDGDEAKANGMARRLADCELIVRAVNAYRASQQRETQEAAEKGQS